MFVVQMNPFICGISLGASGLVNVCIESNFVICGIICAISYDVMFCDNTGLYSRIGEKGCDTFKL